MRTFIIRARKGTTNPGKIRAAIGSKEHFEVVAHAVMNAFFVSNGFRQDVKIHIVLDSSKDFPRTITLSGGEGLSLAGFHEEAIISLMIAILKNSEGLVKNENRSMGPGIQVNAYGFEKLITTLIETHTLYLLSPKGDDIRAAVLDDHPVFILSDHLALPKNICKSLKRKGLKTLSLGKKMLFASQCIVLIHDQLDRK